jgi:hypothetical protein
MDLIKSSRLTYSCSKFAAMKKASRIPNGYPCSIKQNGSTTLAAFWMLQM